LGPHFGASSQLEIGFTGGGMSKLPLDAIHTGCEQLF
jgi:hypothetical protein